jgi:thiamine kinase-like enzyme
MLYETKALAHYFDRFGVARKLSHSMGEKVSVNFTGIECLKTTRRMSVYKVPLQGKTGQPPVILKIYHSVTARNEIEINLYTKAYSVLKEFLPPIYLVEHSGDETWIFMGFIQQVRGQIAFQPAHFEKIIPTLAKMHARTFEGNFKKQKDAWTPWLPVYSSVRMTKEREKYISKTIEFLDESMNVSGLRDIVKPYHKSLLKLYEKGPDFFPELLENGSAVTHGDLHMQNICSNNVTPQGSWHIQFIDWESAKYAPVWFDMVVLVEILIAFRKDWQSRDEEIRTHCVKVYTEQMAKQGIRFDTDPMKLIKMAYVQRTLEKGLHTQLRRIFDNRGGELLPYHLEKATKWAKELGL